MTWSPVTSRRSQPTASGRVCSLGWATSSPSPASPATGWRARPASPASGGDGVCGVRLCQGVLVGGHVLSFCLVGYAVLERFGGQGRAASPGWRLPAGGVVGAGLGRRGELEGAFSPAQLCAGTGGTRRRAQSSPRAQHMGSHT